MKKKVVSFLAPILQDTNLRISQAALFYPLCCSKINVGSEQKFHFHCIVRWVGQWTLMMKIYDFFYSAKSFSCNKKLYVKSLTYSRWFLYTIFYSIVVRKTSFNQHIYDLHFRCEYTTIENWKLYKCSSLVFIAQPDAKCLQC